MFRALWVGWVMFWVATLLAEINAGKVYAQSAASFSTFFSVMSFMIIGMVLAVLAYKEIVDNE